MPLLPRLLLLPLLAPLLAVLLVGALNPRPAVSLRLLTWSSPALPLGLWLALACGGGAALAGAATTLALGQGGTPLQRTVRRPPGRAGAGQEPRQEPWPESWQEEQPRVPSQPQPRSSAAPARPPGEPAPTVSVPFRVIRKGRSAGPAAGDVPFNPAVQAPTPVGGGDSWEQPLNDSW